MYVIVVITTMMCVVNAHGNRRYFLNFCKGDIVIFSLCVSCLRTVALLSRSSPKNQARLDLRLAVAMIG
eukprot:m.750057 g.750057  ORF g.750057 m.750057 type:complete len:69 (+) comp23156_c0_seq12:428-634(+)